MKHTSIIFTLLLTAASVYGQTGGSNLPASIRQANAQADPYPKPMLVELFTDAAEDVRLLKDYYHQLKADRANS